MHITQHKPEPCCSNTDSAISSPWSIPHYHRSFLPSPSNDTAPSTSPETSSWSMPRAPTPRLSISSHRCVSYLALAWLKILCAANNPNTDERPRQSNRASKSGRSVLYDRECFARRRPNSSQHSQCGLRRGGSSGTCGRGRDAESTQSCSRGSRGLFLKSLCYGCCLGRWLWLHLPIPDMILIGFRIDPRPIFARLSRGLGGCWCVLAGVGRRRRNLDGEKRTN